MVTRRKECYTRPPPTYFIVSASSVKILEVKAIEFPRISEMHNTIALNISGYMNLDLGTKFAKVLFHDCSQ